MEFVQFFPIGHLAPRLVGMDPIMWDPFRYKLGGELLNGAMEPFLERYGEREEDNYTVTRDLATYAILSEVEAGRGSPAGGAYLSFMHKSERELREAFGPVIDTLASNGIDLLARPVEVSPIAHYHMGGVRVDESMASRVPGLFAAGEAVGGASGANRLSGNAITEAFVFGHTAGVSAARFALARSHGWRSSWDGSVSALRGVETHTASSHDIESAPLHYLAQLRRRMWDDVGPFRNADSLARTVSWLDEVRSDVLERLSIGSAQAFANDVIDWCELRAALTTAECVAKAALAREESRGAHQRDDFPGLDPEWSRHQSVVLDGEDMAVAAQPKGAF
jgi:succinate dehydrogenase/fumarate reductase flavoprotein subunit